MKIDKVETSFGIFESWFNNEMELKIRMLEDNDEMDEEIMIEKEVIMGDEVNKEVIIENDEERIEDKVHPQLDYVQILGWGCDESFDRYLVGREFFALRELNIKEMSIFDVFELFHIEFKNPSKDICAWIVSNRFK
ncbi:hypothetical protein L1987_48171 [Smallanthus sonchifolius]|uniref:Uncharacterized protein n=1 Tax=Smallanthus sonchifolius TaxID=185202 RepID=A0ACB9FS47_9ASTR|nr:hypothetical protein L1987_48171 [Smallanthus sonchifolius]